MGWAKPVVVFKEETRLLGFEALLGWRRFPRAFQVFFALVLLALAYLVLQPLRRAEMNPALAILWLLWWPILPFTVPFLGRLWCALCPAGAVGDWVQELFPKARPLAPSLVRKFGTWFALASIVTAGLAFLALAMETNGLLTVLLFALTSIGAVVLALPYKGRVWCRWFCPLGMMLGLYGRIGWLEVDPGAAGSRPAVAAARNCPQFTSPVSRQRRHDCILCGLCLKEGKAGTVVVRLNLWPRQGWRAPSLTLVEALAVNLLLGLLLVDSLRMTPLYLKYVTWALPFVVNYRLALTLGSLALMGLILAGQAAFAGWMRRRGNGVRLFRELSLVLIPLALALHLALSAQHLFAGGPGALLVVGVELGLLPSGHMPPSDAYFVSLPLKAFQFLLLGLGAGGMAYLTDRGRAILGGGVRPLAWASPALMLGFIFWQPMSAVC